MTVAQTVFCDVGPIIDMARNRGKKALYEVMSKARNRPGYGRTLERMHPRGPDDKRPAEGPQRAAETPKAAVPWLRKPRIVQVNAGRIEFSMPYQIAVALLLGLVLVILAAFRLGQRSGPGVPLAKTEQGGERPGIGRENPTGRTETDNTPSQASAEIISPKPEEAVPAESTGNHVIVLVEYGTLADLGPVQAHFAEYGIETEIVMQNGRYFLQTKDTYDWPATPGTDGYEALQKIIAVGAKYKGRAPAGYETFAPNFFKDAYGKRIAR